MSCVVQTCKNHTGSVKKNQGVTFHKFPFSNEVWLNDWIQVIRLCRNDKNWNPSKRTLICSKHFEESDLYKTKGGLIRIINYAAPSKFLFKTPNLQEGLSAEINNSAESQENSLVVESATAPESRLQIKLEPFSSQDETPILQPSSLVDESAIASRSGLQIKLEQTSPQDKTSLLQPSSLAVESATASGSWVQIKLEPSSSQDETPLLQPMLSPVHIPTNKPAEEHYFIAPQVDATKSNSPVPVALIEPSMAELIRENKRMMMKLLRMRHLQGIQKKKIKVLNQKVKRLNDRNQALKDILIPLKKNNFVDSDLFNRLNQNSVAADLFNNYNRKKLNKKLSYSSSMKKFCLTLNQCSPKAYDYVRQTFNSCLPHSQSLYKFKDELINNEDGEVNNKDQEVNNEDDENEDEEMNSEDEEMNSENEEMNSEGEKVNNEDDAIYLLVNNEDEEIYNDDEEDEEIEQLNDNLE